MLDIADDIRSLSDFKRNTSELLERLAYRVELARSAETELEELYLWVVERARAHVVQRSRTSDSLSLEHLPKRFHTGGPYVSFPGCTTPAPDRMLPRLPGRNCDPVR